MRRSGGDGYADPRPARVVQKLKVVGLVLVTGWGGFYLGSMLSGISSVQRGLLDTLLASAWFPPERER